MFHLDPYSLKFIDKKLERKYNFFQREHSIRYSKIFLGFLIVMYIVYVASISSNNGVSKIWYIQLFFLCALVFAFCFMNFKKYKVHHYKIITFFLGISFVLKIVFDWLFSEYDKTIYGVVTCLLSCLTIHLNINFIFIVTCNLCFAISYAIR